MNPANPETRHQGPPRSPLNNELLATPPPPPQHPPPARGQKNGGGASRDACGPNPGSVMSGGGQPRVTRRGATGVGDARALWVSSSLFHSFPPLPCSPFVITTHPAVTHSPIPCSAATAIDIIAFQSRGGSASAATRETRAGVAPRVDTACPPYPAAVCNRQSLQRARIEHSEARNQSSQSVVRRPEQVRALDRIPRANQWQGSPREEDTERAGRIPEDLGIAENGDHERAGRAARGEAGIAAGRGAGMTRGGDRGLGHAGRAPRCHGE
ncbi:unnamed protein product [Lampetra fluviatilis]